MSHVLLPGLLLVLSGCFDFDKAYERYCAVEKCGDGGKIDAGTGGGSAAGGGGGAVGGGAGGGGGGVGGGGGGVGGGGVGGGGGGAGGGAGGGGVGGGAGDAGVDAGVGDAGICGGKWCIYSQGGTKDFETTQGVWASSPDSAWVTSYGSRVLRWDGVTWQIANIGEFNVISTAVWGLSPTDVFVGADNGRNYRGPPFTATTKIPGVGFASLTAISGLPDGGSIYASGEAYDIFQYDGTQWLRMDAGLPVPSPVPTLRAMVVVAENDIWTAGTAGLVLHNDGTGWQRIDAGVTENLRRGWATGPNDVWFVGQNGLVLRWNGSGFTKTFCLTCNDIWGVWGQGPNDMWLADDQGSLVHWDGGSFSASIAPSRNDTLPIGLFGAGNNDLFLSTSFSDGGFGVLHFRR